MVLIKKSMLFIIIKINKYGVGGRWLSSNNLINGNEP